MKKVIVSVLALGIAVGAGGVQAQEATSNITTLSEAELDTVSAGKRWRAGKPFKKKRWKRGRNRWMKGSFNTQGPRQINIAVVNQQVFITDSNVGNITQTATIVQNNTAGDTFGGLSIVGN